MQNLQVQRQLERALIGFFVLVALSVVVVLIFAPGVYGQMLSQKAGASSGTLPTALFLVSLLIFITVLIVGVRRHWRWVFWIILLAFSAAVLDVLLTPLQLVGVHLPGVLASPYPVWYSLYRMDIACLQVGIAVWMWRIWMQHGTWAQGRQRASAPSESQT